jgi:protein SCO1/2
MALTALAFAAIVVAAERTRDSDGEEGGAPASRFEGALMPAGVHAPDFALRDERGRAVSMRAYRGRPVVVTFLYANCRETCPIQAQQIKGALDLLRRPVPALAVSVDPPGDTPAAARRFLARAGMDGRMRWVLGSRGELAPLWRGFAIQQQLPHVEHQARIVLVDASGLQRVGFPASQATPERLAHDLRALGAE